MTTRQREPQLRDSGFLAFLRKQRCITCGLAAPVEAAHIRMGKPSIGKQPTGMQEKPHDFWAVPLCAWCHRNAPDSQHNIGEAKFWAIARIDPFTRAIQLYAEYGGTGGRPKARRAPKPRKPKAQRAKMQSRPFPKTKRKFGQ